MAGPNGAFAWIGSRRVAILLVLLLATGGCTSMWESVRESQRRSSIRLARDLVERGSCTRALDTIGRAQSAADLGRFEAESVWLRARCLDRLGRHQQALAHWRLLVDGYPDSTYAGRIPAERKAQLGERAPTRAPSSPPAFESPKPRYERGAEQAKLVGSVWLEFELDAAGGVSQIRVIETPHPLLASFAIESLALGAWVETDRTVIAGRYGAKYLFETYWATRDAQRAPPRAASPEPPNGSETATKSEPKSESGSESAAPEAPAPAVPPEETPAPNRVVTGKPEPREPPGDDGATAESDDDEWEIEWFPRRE
ncbi:MAG: hypothetical protein AAF430_16455 [Myxococcota bacterium]